MKRFVVAGIGVLSMIAGMGSANAADMARRAMPTKAPVYSTYNWSGAYIGLNAGGGFGRSSFDGVPTTGGFNVSGALVGGQLGYNWQFGQTVLGLETDIDWSSIRGSAACGAFSCQTRNDWIGTTRGRIGYAFNRFLPYVTGGAAYGNIKASTTGFPGASDTRFGWTLGAGAEFALAGPLTAKLEYLYADLGKFDCGASCTATPPQNVKFNTNIVRAGLNYRF
ncbi:MAG: porin family protein [Pseudolabrys sp.]|nr:porin family protein [Pseudolabrys sp.]MBV9262521.1 porin family protein [Pseudolabrys sp.]